MHMDVAIDGLCVLFNNTIIMFHRWMHILMIFSDSEVEGGPIVCDSSEST